MVDLIAFAVDWRVVIGPGQRRRCHWLRRGQKHQNIPQLSHAHTRTCQMLAVLCYRVGSHRSGVTLAVHHRLCGLSHPCNISFCPVVVDMINVRYSEATYGWISCAINLVYPSSSVKTKAYKTYMPQTAYCSYSGAFVSHSGRTAYRPQFKPPPRTLICIKTAIRSPGLPFDGLHPCNPCYYMDYY